MGSKSEETASRDSVDSIIEKEWGLVSPNTEILALMFCGVIVSVVEVLGYWPIVRFRDLFPEDTECDEFKDDFMRILYKVSEGANKARYYTVHIYLAGYILLPYPLFTETQKVLLTPWLLCGVLRSVLLNLMITLLGIVLCTYHAKIHYPCLRYSAVSAVEFCFSLYMWTSVHAFYHFLNKKKSDVHEIGKVIKTIHKAGARGRISENSWNSTALSLERFCEDDDEDDAGVEVTLVERAAMAWIAREILETGAEYVSDSQFSEYLTIKATMELRQIIKELAEKKLTPKTRTRRCSKLDKIKGSFEYDINSTPELGLEAFEQNNRLSKRDPIRKIPPLKPFPYDMADSVDSVERELIATARRTSSEHTVEVQTEPVSPGLARLFEDLELQQSLQEYAELTTKTKSAKEDQ